MKFQKNDFKRRVPKTRHTLEFRCSGSQEQLLREIMPFYERVYDPDLEYCPYFGGSGISFFGKERPIMTNEWIMNCIKLGSLDCKLEQNGENNWVADGSFKQTRGLINYIKEEAFDTGNRNLYLLAAKIAKEKSWIGFRPINSVAIFSEQHYDMESTFALSELSSSLSLNEGSVLGFMNAVKCLYDIIYKKNFSPTDSTLQLRAYEAYSNLFKEVYIEGFPLGLRERLFVFDYHATNCLGLVRSVKIDELAKKYNVLLRGGIPCGSDLLEFTSHLPKSYLNEGILH